MRLICVSDVRGSCKPGEKSVWCLRTLFWGTCYKTLTEVWASIVLGTKDRCQWSMFSALKQTRHRPDIHIPKIWNTVKLGTFWAQVRDFRAFQISDFWIWDTQPIKSMQILQKKKSEIRSTSSPKHFGLAFVDKQVFLLKSLITSHFYKYTNLGVIPEALSPCDTLLPTSQ
jgi:hypothetical protein